MEKFHFQRKWILHMRYLITSLVMLGCTSSCIASNWDWTVSFGLSQPNLGNNTLQVTETETDSLIQTRNPWVGDMSTGFSYLMPLNNKLWFPKFRLGANLRYADNNSFGNPVKGTVLQYQEPEMANYTYSIAVRSTRLMADAILTLASVKKASLFAMVGIGSAWNELSYRDKLNPGIQGGSLFLGGEQKSQFASEFGVGLTWELTSNLTGFTQYLYSDLGSVKTRQMGNLNGEPVTLPSISFPLHYNSVLLGINYHL